MAALPGAAELNPFFNFFSIHYEKDSIIYTDNCVDTHRPIITAFIHQPSKIQMMISNKQLVIAISIFLLLIGIGTFGFVLIEDYSLLEGIYMTVITITTVGFGEIKPLSAYGRGFTVILILMGFISLAYAGQAVAESFVETFWKTKAGQKKMNKKISQLKSHYIIPILKPANSITLSPRKTRSNAGDVSFTLGNRKGTGFSHIK